MWFRAFSRHSTSCDVDKHSISCDLHTLHILHTLDKHEKQTLEKDTTFKDESNGNVNASIHQKYSTKTDYQTFDKSNSGTVHNHQSHNDSHVGHSHQENGSKVRNGRQIALRDFFTVLALSIHAIFEGMAIGLQENSADIWILFAGNISISFFKVALNIIKILWLLNLMCL